MIDPDRTIIHTELDQISTIQYFILFAIKLRQIL